MATTFNTRISLKYDSYTNWDTNNPTLLKGEMAIVEVPVETGVAQNEPTYLLKVGDGVSNFKTLKWVSGTAADVYSWAKAAQKPTYQASEIQGLEDFIGEKVEDTDTQYQIVKNGDMGFKLQSKAKDGLEWVDVNEITLTPPTYSLIEGDENGTVKFGITGSEQSVKVHGLGSAAYTEAGAYDAAGSAKAVQGETSSTVKSVEDSITAIKNGSTISDFKGVETALAGKQDNLVFNTEYNSETNKVATMADVNTAKSEANSYTDTKVGEAKTELIGTSSTGATSNTIKGAVDEAKTYADQKIAAQISSTYKAAGSVQFASLPALSAEEEGKVYNVTDAFVTNENFIEGAGKSYPAGSNVVCVDSDDAGTYKWDVLSGVVDLSAYDTAEVAQGKIDAAKQAAIEAAATDATQKANTAEQNAKSYADGLKTTLEGSIALKADKTTVDELTGRVGIVESTLANKADSSIVTAIGERLTTAEGEIDTLQGQIATKAEQSAVEAISTRIDNLDNNDVENDGEFVVSAVQTDGLVAVTRKKVNISKLEQTGGEYIIFNCGNSSANV